MSVQRLPKPVFFTHYSERKYIIYKKQMSLRIYTKVRKSM